MVKKKGFKGLLKKVEAEAQKIGRLFDGAAGQSHDILHVSGDNLQIKDANSLRDLLNKYDNSDNLSYLTKQVAGYSQGVIKLA